MAANTDTLPVEAGEATPEASRPRRARRGALTWAAVVGACVSVAVLGVMTLRGSGDDGDTRTTRFDPKAEVYEREAHLKGQATTYNRAGEPAAPRRPDHRAAQRAEQAERRAHLAGLAKTYGLHAAETPDPPAPAADAPEPEFIPGSRHMPTR